MVDLVRDSYADRLRIAMGERFTVQSLASAMKITYQGVKKVLDERSGAFNVPNHYVASDILGVNPRWLGTGEGCKEKGQEMNGWPLPPHLLAALQNADAKTLKRAQNALMSALDMDLIPAQSIEETLDRPA